MGRLIDAPKISYEGYGAISAYLDEVSGFAKDPDSYLGELSDHLGDLDLKGLVQAIQAKVNDKATLAESALLSSYHDIESSLHEYELRKFSRADYYSDAPAKADQDLSRAQYERLRNDALMRGRDITQR